MGFWVEKATEAWLKRASVEELRAKADEYDEKHDSSPRDVEFRSVLLRKVRAELVSRETDASAQ